jgi:hypothetical protein
MIGGQFLSDENVRDAEETLARFVALAFAADHPELFQRAGSTSEHPQAGSQAGIIQHDGAVAGERESE